MSGRATSSTHQRWASRKDMESIGQRLGLEDFESCGVSHSALCCLGESLNNWLLSSEGWKFLAAKTLVRVNQFQLVRLDWKQRKADPLACEGAGEVKDMTKIQKREWENLQCIGGLRDPRRSVAMSEALRKAGKRIRRCLDSCTTDCMLASFESELGKNEDAVKVAQRAIAKEFRVNAEDIAESGYQASIIRNILKEAEDPDAEVLYSWITEGVPLGISREKSTQVSSRNRMTYLLR